LVTAYGKNPQAGRRWDTKKRKQRANITSAVRGVGDREGGKKGKRGRGEEKKVSGKRLKHTLRPKT